MEGSEKVLKVKHLEDMTPEERLRSLQEFAEEQKYIKPGGGEILPAGSSTNAGGFNSVIFGNEWQGSTSFKMAKPAYDIDNLPPSHKTTEGEQHVPAKDRKTSIFDRLTGKQHKEKDGKSHEDSSVG